MSEKVKPRNNIRTNRISELRKVIGLKRMILLFYFLLSGTQISVEDLFYNVPTRKRVLKSPAEEFHRIADVVSKYAIHNSGKVGFTLKKVGDSNNDLRTQTGASVPDNVGVIYR